MFPAGIARSVRPMGDRCRFPGIAGGAVPAAPGVGAPQQALSVNLLNINERQKPKQLKKNLSRRSPYGPFGYNLLSGSRHTNKPLEAG